MKSLLRFGGMLFICLALSARADLTNYSWTSFLAFPSLTFSSPLAVATPPGETNRLFVVQRGGSLLVISNLANPNSSVFLDLTSRIKIVGEAGLLSMAFHPGYATNHYFYVFYTYTTNLSSSPTYWDVVSRFQTSISDPNKADAGSEVPLFVQFDRANNHNGGDLHFGPDGYLYVSVGDEGMERDAYNNGQKIDSNLFSGILRLDVDKLPGSLPPNPSPTYAVTTNYAIPPDNPFVGATNFNDLPVDPAHVRTEFWAVGFRNPWRFSFDPLTGSLYCGDVGEDTVEEIDVLTNGSNGGWSHWEGNNVFRGGPEVRGYTPPILTYTHGTGVTNGNCVIGGVVYRGAKWPMLYGAYVFGDWNNSRIWGSFFDGTNASSMAPLTSGVKVLGFGTDPRNGDVLFFDVNSIWVLMPYVPELSSIASAETNVVISGTNARPFQLMTLSFSSDLFSNWQTRAFNQADSNGNFNFTISIDPAQHQTFYRLKRP